LRVERVWVTRIPTARLVLEPVTATNAAVLWRLMQSAHLRDYQDVPRYTRDEFARRVATRPKRFDSRATGRFEWLVISLASNEPIGWISLRVGDHARGNAEIGYSILAPHRNAGFATEAARALVADAFETTELRQVDACCVPENLGSRRLLAKIGFSEARVQRNGAVVRGKPVDIVIYEMTRAHWEESARSSAGQGESRNSIVIPASGNPK
jgi:ribosomal-protein-alanine N-acetyltransferase